MDCFDEVEAFSPIFRHILWGPGEDEEGTTLVSGPNIANCKTIKKVKPRKVLVSA
jgi:hypothetical protein